LSEPITFVDTNVLAYALDAADPAKQDRAHAFLTRLWEERAGVVSTQVIAELYAVLTRKLRFAPGDARRLVMPYAAWEVVHVDVPMIAAAMIRNQQDAVSWWDSLIVEAAIRAGATRLASEDFQPGRRFDGALEVVDPVAA
jgi:predicted nucleic acid-binding protein